MRVIGCCPECLTHYPPRYFKPVSFFLLSRASIIKSESHNSYRYKWVFFPMLTKIYFLVVFENIDYTSIFGDFSNYVVPNEYINRCIRCHKWRYFRMNKTWIANFQKLPRCSQQVYWQLHPVQEYRITGTIYIERLVKIIFVLAFKLMFQYSYAITESDTPWNCTTVLISNKRFARWLAAETIIKWSPKKLTWRIVTTIIIAHIFHFCYFPNSPFKRYIWCRMPLTLDLRDFFFTYNTLFN